MYPMKNYLRRIKKCRLSRSHCKSFYCSTCQRNCDRPGDKTAILIVFVNIFHCIQPEITDNQAHKAHRKVCVQQGALLIANGRGLRHQVRNMIGLYQVLTLEMSFKNIPCEMQLAASLFQVDDSIL